MFYPLFKFMMDPSRLISCLSKQLIIKANNKEIIFKLFSQDTSDHFWSTWLQGSRQVGNIKVNWNYCSTTMADINERIESGDIPMATPRKSRFEPIVEPGDIKLGRFSCKIIWWHLEKPFSVLFYVENVTKLYRFGVKFLAN